jgi:hypothetical protein
MKFGRQAGMEGDLNAVIFNSIASNILKWLRFKVRWMHYLHHSALLNCALGLFSIVVSVVTSHTIFS